MATSTEAGISASFLGSNTVTVFVSGRYAQGLSPHQQRMLTSFVNVIQARDVSSDLFYFLLLCSVTLERYDQK